MINNPDSKLWNSLNTGMKFIYSRKLPTSFVKYAKNTLYVYAYQTMTPIHIALSMQSNERAI